MASPRETLIEAIQNNIKSIQSGVNNYTYQYRFVTRHPITQADTDKLNPGEAMVGIYEGTETQTRLFGLAQYCLTVVIEFYFRPYVSSGPTGRPIASYLNTILSELQKAMYTDYTQGGLANNTEEVSNQIDIDGIYDRIVNGAITLELTYRTAMFDPTKQAL